jgi:hypothetical protein
MLSVVAIILVVGLAIIFVARHPQPSRAGGLPSRGEGVVSLLLLKGTLPCSLSCVTRGVDVS